MKPFAADVSLTEAASDDQHVHICGTNEQSPALGSTAPASPQACSGPIAQLCDSDAPLATGPQPGSTHVQVLQRLFCFPNIMVGAVSWELCHFWSDLPFNGLHLLLQKQDLLLLL